MRLGEDGGRSIYNGSSQSMNDNENLKRKNWFQFARDGLAEILALTARCRKTKFCPLLAASFSWLRGLRTSWEGLRTSREGLRTSGEGLRTSGRAAE